jgi:hypothetical protein
MTISDIFANSKKLVESNSSEILTAVGTAGVLVTGYLAVKAGFRSQERLRYVDKDAPVKEKVKATWDLYIPPVVSGVATIGCIIGSAKINSKRTAAAVTVYSLTEKAFAEYREKVKEEIGARKEEAIRDKIAQDTVDKKDLDEKTVILTGAGEVLCYEMYTGRFFKSDMETLRKAQNDINALIFSRLYVTLDEFYDLIGLSHTEASDVVGWNSDKLMELEFSSVLTPKGEPCLAFSYNYVKPL